jgi:hypothetical protein
LKLAASILASALLAAAGAPAAAARTLEDASPLRGAAGVFHPYPLARVDNAVAAVANPAGLAARNSTEIIGLVTDSDHLRDGDSAFLVKRLEVGAAYERYRPFASSASVARLTLATARRITRHVFFGSSYAWYFSKDGDLADLASLDLGLLVRRPPRLSFAATANGLNKPSVRGERLERRYACGLGVSPVARVVLFVEDEIAANENLGATVPAYGVELEPRRGILLRGRLDTDGDAMLALEFHFGQGAYGVVGRTSHDGGSDGRAGYIRLTDEIPGAGPRRGRGR